eukprot:SAG31_NODE_3168_length_4593_cov_205.949933_6_plen_130_part_00
MILVIGDSTIRGLVNKIMDSLALNITVPKLHGSYNFGYTGKASSKLPGAIVGSSQKPSLIVHYTYWPEWWKKNKSEQTPFPEMTLRLVRKEAGAIRAAIAKGSELVFFIGGTFVTPDIIESFRSQICLS